MARVLNATFARLQAAFERQLRFAADASHELRTPLSVIHTKAEVTLNKPRSAAEYVDALETCLRSAKRMRPLVDSLLLLARADAGRLELKLENIDLSHMAEDCAAMLKPLAEDRGVTMQLDLQPTIANVDPFRITQVLANLLTNAILYNRRGGTVTATTRPEGQHAVIAVADTGVGIAGDRLEKSLIASIASRNRARANSAAPDWAWQSVRASSPARRNNFGEQRAESWPQHLQCVCRSRV